jgi:Flp pilus assembly pilin Flp
MKFRSAQSILEYTIILAAIVAGIILAARTLVRPAVEGSFTDATDTMERMTDRFSANLGGGTGAGGTGGTGGTGGSGGAW